MIVGRFYKFYNHILDKRGMIKLAMLKLKPIHKSHTLATLSDDSSNMDCEEERNKEVLSETLNLSFRMNDSNVIENGIYKDKFLTDYVDEVGTYFFGKNVRRFHAFPIRVKILEVKEPLALQVHPPNDYALKVESSYGRVECWYIMDCEEGAYIYYGFNRDVTKQEFRKRVNNGTILEVLNKVYVKKGDTFLIQPGTIHSAGKGIVLAEIQQSSNVSYKVYDFNKIRSNGIEYNLEIDKAIDVINTEAIPSDMDYQLDFIDCDHFIIEKISLKNNEQVTNSVTEDSFVSILITDGEGSISCDGETLSFRKGDSFFIESDSEEYSIQGNCDILATSMGEKLNQTYITIIASEAEVIIAVFDENENLLITRPLDREEKQVMEVLPRVCKTILNILDELEISVADCAGIGVIISEYSPLLQKFDIDFENLAMGSIGFELAIRQYIPLPIYMDNIPNAMLNTPKAEYITENYDKVALVSMNESSIIFDTRYNSLEKASDYKCISKYNIVRKTKKVMLNNHESVLWGICDGDLSNVTEYSVLEFLREREGEGLELFMDIVTKACRVVADVIENNAPDVIVIHGFLDKYSGLALAMLNTLMPDIEIPIFELINQESDEILRAAYHLI